MTYPAVPSPPETGEPPGCCPACTCEEIRLASLGAASYTFGTYDSNCEPTVQAVSLTVTNPSDCRLLDVNVTECTGCGSSIDIPLGTTYSLVILYYANFFDWHYVWLAIKPDLTADIFAQMPATNFHDGPFCTECDTGGDIWAAYNVAISYDGTCKPTVPTTALTRIASCEGYGSPTLSVSIG